MKCTKLPQNNSHVKNPPIPKQSFPVIFGNLGKDVTPSKINDCR